MKTKLGMAVFVVCWLGLLQGMAYCREYYVWKGSATPISPYGTLQTAAHEVADVLALGVEKHDKILVRNEPGLTYAGGFTLPSGVILAGYKT